MDVSSQTNTFGNTLSGKPHSGVPLLICDDDALVRTSLKIALGQNWDVRLAEHPDRAAAMIKNDPGIRVILLDLGFGHSTEAGLKALTRFLEMQPGLQVVIYTGAMDFGKIQTAMRLGAADYVVKSADFGELLDVLNRLKARWMFGKGAAEKLGLLGESRLMTQLRAQIEKVRRCAEPVLIVGESGTGKELVARALAGCETLTAVDCGAIHPETAESQLFGHQKGAFTGATTDRRGVFEDAGDGVLFLDEITNLSLPLQAKLLRVIQEREWSPLGSNRLRPFRARVVAATNQDPEKLCDEGRFKRDLLWRLDVFRIETPALRHHCEDLPILIRGLAPHLEFSTEAMQACTSYVWPGNVRELRNVLSFLTGMLADRAPQGGRARIEVWDLPAKFSRVSESPATSHPGERVEAFAKKTLLETYEAAGRNVSRTARMLGVDRSHLYTKLKRAGVSFNAN
jgi:DNA-binding NtrC family response regulator